MVKSLLDLAVCPKHRNSGARFVTYILFVLRHAAVLGFLLLLPFSANAQDVGTLGTGLLINKEGQVLTCYHVVENCHGALSVGNAKFQRQAKLVAFDKSNDLALLSLSDEAPVPSFANFRRSPSIRVGEKILVIGYPLQGLLSSSGVVTDGMISALSGMVDDTRFFQISAPVQPGNSGGPVLDLGGNVIGIVSHKLNSILAAKLTGDIPQNVNFGLRAHVAIGFLESHGIEGRQSTFSEEKNTADISDMALEFTVKIACGKEEQKTDAAASKSESPGRAETVVPKGRLFVKVNPADATVRIMNIKPRYQPGIELDVGKYDIEVCRSGYETVRKWIEIRNTEDHQVQITLNKSAAHHQPITSQWAYLGQGYDNRGGVAGTFYFDKHSVKIDDLGNYSLTLLLRLDTPLISAETNYRAVVMEFGDVYVGCRTKKILVQRTSYFDEKGSLVTSSGAPATFNCSPGSAGETLIRMLCY